MDTLIQKKSAFIKSRLESHIETFNKKKLDNRMKSSYVKLTIIALSFFVTSLLGIKFFEEKQTFNIILFNQPLYVLTISKILIQDIAFICSALSTAIVSWDAFFNHRALWLQYNITYCALKKIQEEFNYLMLNDLENIKIENLDNIHNRMQQILDETNQNWLGVRNENKNN